MNRSLVFPRPTSWILLLAATLLFAAPIIQHDALPYGSDLGFSFHSAHGFVQAIFEGVPYPRWVDNSNHGFGGPTFIFYAPLPYYLLAAVSLGTGNLVDAFRIALLVLTLLAGLSFFLAARPLATELGATLGATLYIMAPYHTIDLYDRFAFAEFSGFVWMPLLFLFTRRLLQGPSTRDWFGLTLSYTGLLMTHLVGAYMCLFILAPYALFHVAYTRHWKRLVPTALAGATALLCASVYLIPMLSQRDQVHLEWVVDVHYGDWRRNFAFRDEVAHGFTKADIKPAVRYSTTAQAALALVATGILLARYRRRRRMASAVEETAGSGAVRIDVRAWIAMSLWTLFLQVALSTPLWAIIPEMGTLQFPWRFGLFQALAACFLAASAVSALQSVPGGGEDRRRRRRLGYLGASLLAAAVLPWFLFWSNVIGYREYRLDQELARHPTLLGRVMEEYLPQGLQDWQNFRDQPIIPRVRLRDAGNVDVLLWTSHQRRLRVVSPDDNTLMLRTFGHPGWRAWVDGSEAPVDSDNPLRVITLPVAAGTHEIRVSFTATGDRQLGAALSGTTIATMLIFGVVKWRRSREES